ncbi:MAG TPA: aquaporin [Longimicrobiales bacterium]|nr:aquaporin [Longimicrobiales bacterium]
MSRKLIVEAIGTFFLVLTIGLVVLEPGAGAMAPLAIGSVLVAMVYTGGHISGAHYNPAVTLGVFMRGRASAAELAGYWVVQVVGAVCAALAVGFLRPDAAATVAAPAVGQAFLAEFLFTFALVFVVLNVATARGTTGNSYFGLAIGFTVLAGAYSVGAISGGAFNPAVAIGITVLGLSAPGFLWVFVAANLLGGAAAALLFNVLDMGDDKAVNATPAEQAQLQGAADTGA